MKQCGRCEQPARVGQKLCRACHAAYMREWRKTHALTPEQRKKDTCRSYANVYKRRGKLQQKPCEVCADGASQMHHPDYNAPLKVQWLCRPCHIAAHKLADVSLGR